MIALHSSIVFYLILCTMETANVKFESNLALGDRLFAENAKDQKILNAYKANYAKVGKTDVAWIKGRAAIYMRIAERKAIAAEAK